ncbi:kinase-like domain-containing protein [Gigaspora rosea]|uniref:Kinase-like domain-containing protein n=1 Tax=Gigaspora rosea TaxID=44941 RepID=A0A397VFI2_9GLOM|nr:kinase-like domain-containing protein [Gigaspora rosea]
MLTSGNKDIDDCIKEFQLNGTSYEDIVEWIPFNRLNIIQKFDDGFLATWLDGVRDAKYIRYKDIIEWIPFDRLNNIQEIAKEDSDALTQNIATNQYLMAFQYVNSSNLHQYLRINFKKLTWKDKLLRLTNISKDLIQIHEWQHKEDLWLEKIIKSYIADLGLSQNNKESTLKKGVYGVMLYIPPEILLGRKYTQAVDIFGFGVVMAEITTGIPPFDLFDNDLALKICGGLRLKFAPGTPDCYIKLAKLYMNSDPQKRPTAKVLFDEFSK